MRVHGTSDGFRRLEEIRIDDLEQKSEEICRFPRNELPSFGHPPVLTLGRRVGLHLNTPAAQRRRWNGAWYLVIFKMAPEE